MGTSENSRASRRRVPAGAFVVALVTVAAPVIVRWGAPEAFAQSSRRQSRPSVATLAIGGENQNQREVGRGRNVLVSGSGNKVLIRGTAATVRVTGNNNEVRVQNVRQIEVTGTNNKVFYVRGAGGRAVRVYQRSYNEVRQDPGAV